MSNTRDNNQPEAVGRSRRTSATGEFDAQPTQLQLDWVVDDGAVSPLSENSARDAVLAAAEFCGFDRGVIGIRITSDAEIHRINLAHLGHDYPTDVISFSYRCESPWIEGELVASCETAVRCAKELGWSAANELLLYIVHGTLHIAGMDDQSDEERDAMRDAERIVLTGLGVDRVARFAADRAEVSFKGGSS